jgi:hypothetical protein
MLKLSLSPGLARDHGLAMGRDASFAEETTAANVQYVPATLKLAQRRGSEHRRLSKYITALYNTQERRTYFNG